MSLKNYNWLCNYFYCELIIYYIKSLNYNNNWKWLLSVIRFKTWILMVICKYIIDWYYCKYVCNEYNKQNMNIIFICLNLFKKTCYIYFCLLFELILIRLENILKSL